MIKYIPKMPLQIRPSASKPAVTPRSAGREIVSSFEKMFDEVNKAQQVADTKVSEVLSGTNRDIPAAMIAMEKASISKQMLMAVRNKIVSAYEEVMRMQV